VAASEATDRILARMATVDRSVARGERRGRRALADFGDEVRGARIAGGLSQDVVARVVGSSGPQISRIERGALATLSVVQASRLASVLGLDLVLRTYPGAQPLRDAAHASRLAAFLGHVRQPLSYALEVPLPALPDRPEHRAWDAVIRGDGKRTAVELEMRLQDSQALERRINLKRRDDPTEGFILLVADTRRNRRVLAEYSSLFPGLPRLRPASVQRALAAGEHPPSGVLLV
jgi:transcriptional regulator with XRE-family HTH domain